MGSIRKRIQAYERQAEINYIRWMYQQPGRAEEAAKLQKALGITDKQLNREK